MKLAVQSRAAGLGRSRVVVAPGRRAAFRRPASCPLAPVGCGKRGEYGTSLEGDKRNRRAGAAGLDGPGPRTGLLGGGREDCVPESSLGCIGIPWLRVARTISIGILAAASIGLATGTPGVAGHGAFASIALAVPAMSAEGMATAFRSAWAGLAAGCLHTLAGADHLAALTPLTIGQSHLRASMLGALWGFGHSTGQLMLGLLMVILKDRFQQLVPALSKWGGTTVGLTLLAIGALGVWESFFDHHHHHHDHRDHHHDQEGEAATPVAFRRERKGKGFGLATFATGIVYGLQPDALFVIIPALALPTKLAATAYILMFVLGTVAAMGAYAGVIGATSQVIKNSNTKLTSNLSGAASAMAILIGFGVLLSAGFGINTPLALA
jgi:hypothetical protein